VTALFAFLLWQVVVIVIIIIVICIIIIVVIDVQIGVLVTTATLAPLDGGLVIIAIGVVAIAFGQGRVLCEGPLGKRHFPGGYAAFPTLPALAAFPALQLR